MLEVIYPDWPAPRRVRALQTTRAGGVSQAPFDSFNLGAHVGDDPASVAHNRQLLTQLLPAEPVWLEQVHGVRIMDLDAGPDALPADGALSHQAGRICTVMTADCLPALFCDRSGTVVAAAHAGWRGLRDGVLESTLAAMGVPPEEIIVWLGAAIGPAAFEVGAEVREAFLAQDAAVGDCFRAAAPGKYLADLYALARRRLVVCGVREIHGGDLCTYRDAGRFYSYRRDGQTGRMATLIWLDDREPGV